MDKIITPGYLRLLMFGWVTLLITGHTSFGQKTDKIQLINGDIITGEVKQLQYGKLTYKTDDAGTLSVNWDKVVRINSSQVFEVMNTNGLFYFGALAYSDQDGWVNIVVGPAATELRLLDIVSMVPIKNRFFKRLTGPISLGLGYTKENDLLQATYNAGLSYRYKKIYANINIDGQFTLQYDTNRTQRQSYNLYMGRQLRKRWFMGGLGSVEQNSALDLRLRGALGIAAGRTLLLSNRNNLSSHAGFQGTRESYYTDEPSTSNIEFVFEITFRRFLYHTPKSEIITNLTVYPNLTNPGRVRGQYNLSLKQELFKDFFLDISLYANYDNKPSETTSGKLDWGITTSLGYTL